MATGPSKKQQAWPLFDRIIADRKVDGDYTSPWSGRGPDATYVPDYDALRQLLGVPSTWARARRPGFQHSLSTSGSPTSSAAPASSLMLSGHAIPRPA